MGLRIAQSKSGGPVVLVAGSGFGDSMDEHGPAQIQAGLIGAALGERGIGIELISMEQLLSLEPKRSAMQTPVLVMIDEHDSDAQINQVVEHLEEHLSPALVLVPESQSHATLLIRSTGMMCEAMEIDPVHAGIILWTLAQRQPAIHQLVSDLRITEMSVHSVHSEMNKLHEELATAASIQREYMPAALPSVEGIEMGIVYRPASYVSGDIYDVIELDEDHTGFFLADAVGHGVPAALMTMVITQGLHKIEGKGEQASIIEPGEALRRLNNTMTEHSGEQARFATAAYAIHNKRTNEITVAGAGHPPALLVRSATGEVEQIESDGPLLGVFPDVEFGEVRVQMEPGDVFIIYSDGFEVAFPNEGATGDERKRPTLTYIKELTEAGSGIETLGDAIATLESHLDNQSGSLHQPDDITALFMASSGTLSGSAEG